MSAGQVPRLGALESIQATFMRAMLAPLWPLALLVLAIVRGVAMPVFFVLFVLLLGVLGTALVTALSPGLFLYGNRLEVRGLEGQQEGAGGTVNLAALSNVKSVSLLRGRLSGRGPSFLRSMLLLEDSYGGSALFPAWGWSPKRSLQRVLREAALDSEADIDEMSYWRLGFRNDEFVKVSHLRRFV